MLWNDQKELVMVRCYPQSLFIMFLLRLDEPDVQNFVVDPFAATKHQRFFELSFVNLYLRLRI